MRREPENPAAFPVDVAHYGRLIDRGMTLRDYLAAQVLTGLCANNAWDQNGWTDRARAAYEAADAMLKARGES
ncbi:hypothetical protein [Ruegeria sp. EL01]|jgi:hypothetical protein|uniref:hypothetical protein n=1 Tax=Ruegeria sp. EL01 TaxID=2107578 RepID=UPI000EA82727|nr:hypothetical protein [Ruegeria sp. EL01]